MGKSDPDNQTIQDDNNQNIEPEVIQPIAAGSGKTDENDNAEVNFNDL
jgi:hypothetical protein